MALRTLAGFREQILLHFRALTDALGLGWDRSGLWTLFDIEHDFIDDMRTFQDALPLDVSGHPILCGEQSGV